MENILTKPAKHIPPFTEVYEYAKKSVSYFLSTKAKKLTEAQKEEAAQEAFMRVWSAYQHLEPTGWKSFIQFHVRGAILDYMKAGKADVEGDFQTGSPKKIEVCETVNFTQFKTTQAGLLKTEVQTQVTKMINDPSVVRMKRFEIPDSDDEDILSAEETLGIVGINGSGDVDVARFQPDWELLARLAAHQDQEDVHVVAKVLLGFTQEQIAEQLGNEFGVERSRERVSQRIHELFQKFDSISRLRSPVINQSIYALGLCKFYHMPEVDNGFGWDREPIDLTDPLSFKKLRTFRTPTLMDFAPGAFKQLD